MPLESTSAPETRPRRGRAAIATLTAAAAVLTGFAFAPEAGAADLATVGFVVTDTRPANDRSTVLKFLGVEVPSQNLGFEETNSNGRPQLPVVGATLPGPSSGQRFELFVPPSFDVHSNEAFALYGEYRADNETQIRTFRIKMGAWRTFLNIPVRDATCGFCRVQYRPSVVYIDVNETP